VVRRIEVTKYEEENVSSYWTTSRKERVLYIDKESTRPHYGELASEESMDLEERLQNECVWSYTTVPHSSIISIMSINKYVVSWPSKTRSCMSARPN
jgi:hypothetical protein